MRKFASLFAITFSCACLSAFAQDTSGESADNSEVTIQDDGDEGCCDELTPRHSGQADCGCGGKPKK